MSVHPKTAFPNNIEDVTDDSRNLYLWHGWEEFRSGQSFDDRIMWRRKW